MSNPRQVLARAGGYEVEAVTDQGQTKWGWISPDTGEESELLYPTPQEAWRSAADWAVTNALSEHDMTRREWATLDLYAQSELIRECYTTMLRPD